MANPDQPMLDKIERLRQVYFSDPTRRVSFAKGDRILTEGEPNNRLYLILEGEVVAQRHYVRENPETASTSHKIIEVFRAGAGSYFGVQSFFSGIRRGSSDITAETDVIAAYIDDTIPAVEPDLYGSLTEQFVPIMVHEMALRNTRMLERAVEREDALRLLHSHEVSATLGQLSAGIAHELNNAIGVMGRKTEFVADFIRDELLRDSDPSRCELYRLGTAVSIPYTAEELRALARRYEHEFNLNQPAAKVLARMAPTEEQLAALDKSLLARLNDDFAYWELGHDIHDLLVAAKHAAGIVRAVKDLGGGNTHRDPDVNLAETIDEAVSLVKSHLKGVKLIIDNAAMAKMPRLYADTTELVQVWVNLIKNACDAMMLAGTPDPTLEIRCQTGGEAPPLGVNADPVPEYVIVSVIDNGPGVPDSLREKIFQPSFSTKKKGLSFGLGLGLAIVRRIVDSYNGKIGLNSTPGRTCFTIKLPLN